MDQAARYYIKKRAVGVRLALCDDERYFLEELKTTLSRYAADRGINMTVGEFGSGEELLGAPAEYDVIFLDQKLGGLDGLEVARRLRERHTGASVVFLTGYPDFVYQAFEVSAFRFIEKPAAPEKIYAALDDYRLMSGNDVPLLLRRDKTTVCVETGDIVFAEAVNKHCILHRTDGHLYVTTAMAAVKRLLPRGHFFQISRTYIANLNMIDRYGGGEIFFKNGEKVRLSRMYAQAFKKAYRDHSFSICPKRR